MKSVWNGLLVKIACVNALREVGWCSASWLWLAPLRAVAVT